MHGIGIKTIAPDGTERKLAFQWEPGADQVTVRLAGETRAGDPGDTISLNDLRKAVSTIEAAQ